MRARAVHLYMFLSTILRVSIFETYSLFLFFRLQSGPFSFATRLQKKPYTFAFRNQNKEIWHTKHIAMNMAEAK